MISVALLGATGTVGQRIMQLLDDHRDFKITQLIASENSAKKKFSEAVKFVIDDNVIKKFGNMEVGNLDEVNADLILSALPSAIAGPIEDELRKKGMTISSNARSHRLDKDVPLLIPEINPESLELLKRQKFGKLVTDPNCTTIILTLALKPTQDLLGIKSVNVTTMQALSGAGFPGVASLSIADNVIPHIQDEERAIEQETLKILNSNFDIFASCNRVNVTDGHMETVVVETEKDCLVDELKESLRNFKGLPQELKLPTAPEHPIIVMDADDRPQPFLDRMAGNGMSICVGRIRKLSQRKFRFYVLGNNVIRGAAGAAVLNAELMLAKGLI